MKIKLNEDCESCPLADRNKIVEAVVNCAQGANPSAVYFCEEGNLWYLDKEDYKIMREN